MAEIAVIGAGYVGLTTAACFSQLGHEVICADIDEAKIAQLVRGELPIVEAGLEALVREGLEGGRLSFVMGAANAASSAEGLAGKRRLLLRSIEPAHVRKRNYGWSGAFGRTQV